MPENRAFAPLREIPYFRTLIIKLHFRRTGNIPLSFGEGRGEVYGKF